MYKVGDILGGCKLLKECGKGSFGSVFLAENLSTHLPYALKILYKQGNHFERELAGLIAYQKKCSHANLMRIYHVEQNDECIFYLMDAADNLNGKDEYISDTLGNRLRKRKRLNAAELKLMLDELLNGLEILHGMGLLHRDIKPDNILWVNGRAVLGDIGLVAQGVNASMAGTPGFISPEVWNGKRDFEQHDDLYALAMTLYCALGGGNPKNYPDLPRSLTLGGGRDLIRAYNAVLAPDSTIRTVADWRATAAHPRNVPARRFDWQWLLPFAAILVGLAGGWFWTGIGESRNAPAPAPVPFAPVHEAGTAAQSAAVVPSVSPDALVAELTAEWEADWRARIRRARGISEINIRQGSSLTGAEWRKFAENEAAERVRQLETEMDYERDRLPVLRQFSAMLVRHFPDVWNKDDPSLARALRHQQEIYTRLNYHLPASILYGQTWLRTGIFGFSPSQNDGLKQYEKDISSLPESEQLLLKRRAIYEALREKFLPVPELMRRYDAADQISQWDERLKVLPAMLR